MKYFVFMFFFGLSLTAFSANTVMDESLKVLNNLPITEITNESSDTSVENAVVFECYYTVEWLYIDSPFIKKLDALA